MKKLLLFIVLFTILSTAVARSQVGAGYGQTAPGFTLSNLSGKNISLKSLKKKGPVLLVFWSTRCGYCQVMIPDFKKLDKKYRSRGLSLVALNVGRENLAEVKRYARYHKIRYMILNEDKTKNFIANLYQIRGTPTFKLIATDGTIRFHGHRLPSTALLEAILAE